MSEPVKKPMTIAQRVVLLQTMAQVAKGDEVRKMLNETAEVLNALSVMYNRLYNAGVETVNRSNGSDQALNILVDEMRRQSGELPWLHQG